MTELIRSISLAEATDLNKAIAGEVATVKDGEIRLNRGYARLAALLARFKVCEGWRLLSFPSMNQYMLSLVPTSGRSVQQLYSYMAVAEALLPQVGGEALDAMGVSKAFELAKAAKRAGKPVTAALIAAALDDRNGINEIRALAHRVYELPPDEYPKGTWLDMGGFYATAEFRKLFKEAVAITVRLLGLPKEMPDWCKRQRVIEAWAQEFVGTHSAEVYGKQEPRAEEDASLGRTES